MAGDGSGTRGLKWWPPWDPSSAVVRPTTTGGRILVGAEAEDRRRDIVQTMRYQRGRRPPAEREETVVDGKRVLLGGQAITRTYAMRWLGSVGGDNLHVDDDRICGSGATRTPRAETRSLGS